MASCLTCAFDKKKALRKLDAQEAGSTLTLPREEEARLLAELARGSSSSLQRSSQRSTGSSSRDPHCVVAQDFASCAADEISVKRGDCVRELYRDGDWSFIVTTAGSNGFVPSSFLKPIALLFSTNAAAQEQMRAKTFDRNNVCRASIDSRRSTQSWSSNDSSCSVSTSSNAVVTTGKKRSLPDSVSARELWIPPRGKSDFSSSQPVSRTHSPRPGSSTSTAGTAGHVNHVSHDSGARASPSGLSVVGTRHRPTSCTPTRLRQATGGGGETATSHHALHGQQEQQRCGSATGWSETHSGVTPRRAVSGIARPDGTLASRRATSLRNVRISTARGSAPRHVRMAYNFEANTATELCVSKGEEVVVLEEHDDDWLLVKRKTGQQGRVPKCMTTDMNGSTGPPSVEQLPKNFIFNKPRRPSTTVRDSVATDITDDSAIATGDESCGGSRANSRRSSLAGFDTSHDNAAPSPPVSAGPASLVYKHCPDGSDADQQFSTMATRHNSPAPTDTDEATDSNTDHTDMKHANTQPEGGASPNKTCPDQRSPQSSTSSRASMSSTKTAMLEMIRAREAVGDNRTRLVVIFDYTALVADEMDVKSGDIVLETTDRSKPGWVWAVLPRTNQEGYIPLAFTHPHGTQVNEQRQITAL
ncbi:uncharacterized protein LOC135811257 isoform X2 [Sycon ciliatum]|uniref:uncharacterized protein LOC135811257 isoform X2 n=1 Tax=Sycon ciliatum TaxID=27933 RepID=UPI0031F71AD3